MSSSSTVTTRSEVTGPGAPKRLSHTLYTPDEDSFLDYLVDEEGRFPGCLDALYKESMWTCAAIFRGLTPLAQSFVARLLMTSKFVPESTLKAWTRADKNAHAQDVFQAAIQQLNKLKLLFRKVYASGKCNVKLHPDFSEGLRKSFTSDVDTPWKRCKKLGKHAATVQQLKQYHKECWESILNHLLKNPLLPGMRQPAKSALVLVKHRGLMVMHEDGEMRITQKGFQFLLQSTYSQTWALLRQFFTHLKANENAPVIIPAGREGGPISERISWLTAVSFLARLSFLVPGDGYLERDLTEHQRSVLLDFREFGLIYKSRGARRYFPTPLVVSLFAPPPTRDSIREGNVIVETNFRVYIYTNSAIQISTMLLFLQPFLKLPNMVVGVLTRESVREAVNKGISADQILTYLRANAHPQALKRVIDGVPETVIEQIELWANERTRVRFERDVILVKLLGDADFQCVVSHATSHSSLHFSDSRRRMVVITSSCFDCLKSQISLR